MRSDLQLRRFAIDIGINFTRLIAMTVLGIGTSVILSRGLGPESKGIYDLALLLPQIIQILINQGIPFAIVYYVANGTYELRSLVPNIELLSIGLGIIGVIICIAVAGFAGSSLFPEISPSIFAVSFTLMPLLYLRSNLGAIFQGLQDFRTMSMIEMLPSIFSLLLLVILVLLLNLAVLGAIVALIVGNLIAVGFAIVKLKKLLINNTSFPILNLAYLRQIMSYGWKQQINVIVVFLLMRVDVFLINLIGGGPTSVGIYSVAVVLGERIWTLSGFAGNVLMPRIASWQGENDKQNQLTLLVARHTFWLSLVILGIIVFFGKWVIGLLYGDEFRLAADALYLLLPGIMMFNLARIIGADIGGRGHPEILSLHSGIAFGINLILNLILVPRFDIQGAAIASSIAYSYLGISLTIIFCRINHLNWVTVWLPTSEDVKRLGRLLLFVQRKLH